MNTELEKYIEENDGVDFFAKKNYIRIRSTFDTINLSTLLAILRTSKIDFGIYDYLYPSPSDPGAYISYSMDKVLEETNWSMTLGNHSWSGGIYQISEIAIANQLEDIIRKNKMIEIKIVDVAFFRNYSIKNALLSAEIENEIMSIHKL